jgi:anti-sigma factor RsiW
MKCSDCEKQIWVLPELSENDRQQVLAHVEKCENCASQLVHAKKLAAFTAVAHLAEPSNAGRLTSQIMQSVAGTPASKPSILEWVMSYGLRATSMALVVWFIVEQVPAEQISKRMSTPANVILNTSQFFNAYRDSRSTKGISFYAQYQKLKKNK